MPDGIIFTVPAYAVFVRTTMQLLRQWQPPARAGPFQAARLTMFLGAYITSSRQGAVRTHYHGAYFSATTVRPRRNSCSYHHEVGVLIRTGRDAYQIPENLPGIRSRVSYTSDNFIVVTTENAPESTCLMVMIIYQVFFSAAYLAFSVFHASTVSSEIYAVLVANM